MLVVAFALGSAVAYGLSDFLGGLLSRRTNVWSVALVTQCTAFLVIALASLVSGGEPASVDWVWGAVAGIGTGVGTAVLYRGLSRGRMGVVAPLSALGSASVPVIVGVATGERPSVLVWAGVALAIPAIWLIASERTGNRQHQTSQPRESGLADGLIAGMAFGLMFAALGRVTDDSGFGPLAAAEATSIGVVICVAVALRQPWVPRDRASWGGVAVGAFAAAAAALFVLATHTGLLTVAAVFSSLYPGITVLLAALVLKEQVHRHQGFGLLLAAVAVAVVAGG